MIDVTVKTLDGQTKSYSIPETMTVKEFKERISSSINISPETQRLIFHGKVMQDEKKLKDYDVHGKVIHVVQRAPPSARTQESSSTSSTGPRSTSGGHGSSVVLGSFTLSSEVLDSDQVQNIVQQATGGMRDTLRNVRVSTRPSNDGSSLDVNINVGGVNSSVLENGARLRLNHARQMLAMAREAVEKLEKLPEEQTSTNGEGQPSPPTDSTEESDMDTSSPSEASATAAEQSETSSGRRGSQGATASGGSRSSGNTSEGGPHLSSLSEVMGEMMEVHTRLQPHVNQLRDYMTQDGEQQNETRDPEETRKLGRMYNLVSEALHSISHCYHNLSDLMVDMSAASPRQLFTPPLQPVMVGIQTQGMPRPRGSIHISTPVRPPQGQPRPAAPPRPPGNTTAVTVSSTTSVSQSAGISTTSNNSGFVTTASSEPYVYVEVGPDSVSFNSISAHVTAREANRNASGSSAAADTTNTTTSTSTSSSTTSTSSTTSSTPRTGPPPPTAPPPPPHMPDLTGLIIPGLPVDMGQILNIMQQQGAQPGQHVQIGNTRVLNMGAFPAPRPGAPPGHTRAPRPAGTSATTAPTAPTTTDGTTSSTASSSTQTSTTTSSATQGSQTPMGVPVSVPVPQPADPFLPCNSRHFLTQMTRNFNSQQMAQGPEGALSDMVSNLMNGLFGPPRTAPASAAPGGPTTSRPTSGQSQGQAASQDNTRTTTSTTGSIPANPFEALLTGTFGPIPGARAPQGGGIQGPPMVQMLRDMLQAGNPQAQQPQGQGQPAAMSDDAFTRLVAGIGSYMSRAATGQENHDTVHDFLSTLGDSYTASSGEGFINDVFQCLSRHVTFGDLFQILFGNPVPLNRLRTPLQEFIGERVLNGEAYTEASLTAGVERIMEEMQSEIDEAVAVVTVKEDIDLNATLKRLFQQNLMKICKQIMDSPTNDADFGRHLYTNLRRTIEEFVILSTDCLVEGTPAFERMLHSRLRHMTAGTNPMIQQWMVSMISQQLGTFRQNMSVSIADVQHYIVRRSKAEKPKSSSEVRSESPMETETASSEAKRTSQKPAIPPKPSLDKRPRPVSSPVLPSVERGKRTFMNGAGAGSDGASPSHSASPSSPPRDEDDSWQGVVPADWVPIINRDIDRQRHNGVQPPFSDVYTQGMPPKRRRMMVNERPNAMTNMAEYMPESIKRAATAAGVQPISSLENLSQEAADESELQSALEEEVERVLSRRLLKDTDYNADKFPSSKQVFKKKNDRT